MRWKYLVFLVILDFVVGEEDESKKQPEYKPLVSPEEMDYVDNAEIQEILGSLQTFYDRIKMAATTPVPEMGTTSEVEENMDIPPQTQFSPIYRPHHRIPEEPLTTYPTERSTTLEPLNYDQHAILNHYQAPTPKQEPVLHHQPQHHNYQPQIEAPVHQPHHYIVPQMEHIPPRKVEDQIEQHVHQPHHYVVPQVDHLPHQTVEKQEQPQPHQPHHYIVPQMEQHQAVEKHVVQELPQHELSQHSMVLQPQVFQEQHETQQQIHPNGDHLIFHHSQIQGQPQLTSHHTHVHAQMGTPHVVIPHPPPQIHHPRPMGAPQIPIVAHRPEPQQQPQNEPQPPAQPQPQKAQPQNQQGRHEIEIEYQYQPHARVIGHLTEDQEIRLYKNRSPDINNIAKDIKYHSKKYDPRIHRYDHKNHDHYEAQSDPESHFDSKESHFPEDPHYESQGAKVELMDEQSSDDIIYGNSPGFHLDENESNYYIEPLK